tara:strand:+ start:788 stop:961 length:174 start_codon:yes stop_codon:yes gene_type:complete
MARKIPVKHEKNDDQPIKTPLWKWLIFIAVAISMPALFSFYGDIDTEQAIEQTDTPN